MSENIQTQSEVENQPVFPLLDTENEDSTVSSTVEETDTDQTQSEEGEQTLTEEEDDSIENKTNFADHPRWKEREDDWKNRFNEQEKRYTDDIAKLREDLENKFNQTKQIDENSNIPHWFGSDDPQQWEEFQKWNNSLVEKAKSEAVEEINSRNLSQQKAIDDATSYFNNELKSIESDKTLNSTGETIDKNKLLKIVLDNKLVDTDGNWNYKAGYALMKANITKVDNSSVKEKKQIAVATTSEHTSETKPSEVVTSDDFSNPSNRPW